MKNLIYIVLFLFPFLVNAQDYIPCIVEGNSWSVMEPKGLGSYNIYDYYIGCDTMLNDKDYKIVNKLTGPIIGYVREDIEAQEIYWWNKDSLQESLHLSFDLQEGDIFEYYWAPIKVDSVRYKQSFGKMRKKIYFNSQITFTEGVGMDFFGIFFINNYSWITSFEEENYECGYILTSNEEPDPIADFKIYPNPVRDFFQVEMESGRQETLNIYHVSGQWIDQIIVQNGSMVNTSDWQAGLYFLVDEAERVTKVAKF